MISLVAETEKRDVRDLIRLMNEHCLLLDLNLVFYTIFCGGIQVLVKLLSLIYLFLEITA